MTDIVRDSASKARVEAITQCLEKEWKIGDFDAASFDCRGRGAYRLI
jgi:hypothetical protein